MSDYVKVVECCLDAFNEEEAGLSGMNGGEFIFDTEEEKRRREENGEKTDKVKVAGGKKFPACGLYEWIFL